MAIAFTDLLTALGGIIGLPEPVGVLAVAIAAPGDTSMAMAAQPVPVVEGDVLEIEDELLRVSAVTRSSPNDTFTIQRGVLGSTAAAHSSGLAVTRFIRYPRYLRKQALNKVLTDWVVQKLPRVQVDSTQLFSATSLIVAVPATAIGVVSVEYQEPGYGVLTRMWHGRPRAYPTALASTGRGVPLIEFGPAGYTAYVTYTTPWAALAAADSSQLPADWAFSTDVLAQGAAAMLLQGKQAVRATFDDAHVQRDEDQQAQVATLPRVSAQDALVAYNQLLSDSMQGWQGSRPIIYREGC